MIIAYRVKNSFKQILRTPWKAISWLPTRAKLMVAQIANRVLPFISIEHARLYPPKTSVSTADWILQFGRKLQAEIQPVDVSYTVLNKAPETIYKQVRRTLLMDQKYPCPQTFVASIPRGRVFHPGLVITPDDQLLDDVSVDFFGSANKLLNISRRWSAQPITDVDGTVAVLATMAGSLYYHWLFQLLPRFELIRRARIDLAAIDYFLIDTANAPYQRESLEALKIDNSKIIVSSTAPYLRARELIVPSVPLSGGCFAHWMCEFLRKTFFTENDLLGKSSIRRLYIPRGNATYRRVLNEADVVRFLGRHGFEVAVFETLTVRQQAAIMASCEVVVAPHGGGLSNLVFCSPGTKIIEIFSPELVAAYYWKLSNQLRLNYYYMLGNGPAATLEADYSQSWDARADIEIDLQNLEKTLVLAGVD